MAGRWVLVGLAANFISEGRRGRVACFVLGK